MNNYTSAYINDYYFMIYAMKRLTFVSVGFRKKFFLLHLLLFLFFFFLFFGSLLAVVYSRITATIWIEVRIKMAYLVRLLSIIQNKSCVYKSLTIVLYPNHLKCATTFI